MSEIVEKPFVNGRPFELTLREVKDRNKVRWIAFVKAVGKEHYGNSSESFRGLSDAHARHLAEE